MIRALQWWFRGEKMLGHVAACAAGVLLSILLTVSALAAQLDAGVAVPPAWKTLVVQLALFLFLPAAAPPFIRLLKREK